MTNRSGTCRRCGALFGFHPWDDGKGVGCDTFEPRAPESSPKGPRIYDTCRDNYCRVEGAFFEKHGERHSALCVAARLEVTADEWRQREEQADFDAILAANLDPKGGVDANEVNAARAVRDSQQRAGARAWTFKELCDRRGELHGDMRLFRDDDVRALLAEVKRLSDKLTRLEEAARGLLGDEFGFPGKRAYYEPHPGHPSSWSKERPWCKACSPSITWEHLDSLRRVLTEGEA